MLWVCVVHQQPPRQHEQLPSVSALRSDTRLLFPGSDCQLSETFRHDKPKQMDPDPQPIGKPRADTPRSAATWAPMRGREALACTPGAPPRAQASADYFSGQLGIRDVRAGLTPEDKLSAVRSLRSDAPAGRFTYPRRLPSAPGDGFRSAEH